MEIEKKNHTKLTRIFTPFWTGKRDQNECQNDYM